MWIDRYKGLGVCLSSNIGKDTKNYNSFTNILMQVKVTEIMSHVVNLLQCNIRKCERFFYERIFCSFC